MAGFGVYKYKKNDIYKNSQAVEKGCGSQKARLKKRYEIQDGGQEMAVMVGYNDNSGEFCVES